LSGRGPIHQLPIPTPFAVGPVNCYLVEDDPLTLVDCGPNSGTALVELEAAMQRAGRRLEDLERIVLTHQHIDHIGLAQIVADRSGAEICALDELAPWLAAYGESMEEDDVFAEEVMLRHGIPRDMVNGLRNMVSQLRAWGHRAHVSRPLPAGSTLAFADREWQVLHRPGHSPSDTVFYDAASRELVGGDHLIGHISSNPLISRPLDGGNSLDRPKSLLTYLDSLDATAAMEVDVVLPGHGDTFGGHAEIIATRHRMHDKRAAKIAGLLSGGPLTAHEIALRLWGKVAIAQAYLTLSEVLGHTDLLEREGRVVEQVGEDGVVRFAVA
jgi:glyoxylase-like metal-dependent hydrolase (beta-lactamase superfamily II)